MSDGLKGTAFGSDIVATSSGGQMCPATSKIPANKQDNDKPNLQQPNLAEESVTPSYS